MPSKIEFYREVLRDDPTSRVFFPLAKMLAQSGQTEEAVTVLTNAVSVQPGHLEARFLLVELLTRLGRAKEGASVFEELLPLLSDYPSVWSLWADKAKGLSRDSSVAMHLVAQNLAGADISFLDLLEKGLEITAEPAAGAGGSGQESRRPKPAKPELVKAGPSAPSETVSREEPAETGFKDFSLRGAAEVQALAKRIQDDGGALETSTPCVEETESPVKTRTMADLLVKRGDYAQALNIYGALLGRNLDPVEREVLKKRMEEIKTLSETGAPAQAEPRKKDGKAAGLRNILESLASRLDAHAV